MKEVARISQEVLRYPPVFEGPVYKEYDQYSYIAEAPNTIMNYLAVFLNEPKLCACNDLPSRKDHFFKVLRLTISGLNFQPCSFTDNTIVIFQRDMGDDLL